MDGVLKRHFTFDAEDGIFDACSWYSFLLFLRCVEDKRTPGTVLLHQEPFFLLSITRQKINLSVWSEEGKNLIFNNVLWKRKDFGSAIWENSQMICHKWCWQKNRVLGIALIPKSCPTYEKFTNEILGLCIFSSYSFHNLNLRYCIFSLQC